MRVSTSPPGTSVVWQSAPGTAGPPLVAGDNVWWLSTTSGELVAASAANGHEVKRLPVGSLPSRFTSAAAALGRIFVPAGRQMLAFGS